MLHTEAISIELDRLVESDAYCLQREFIISMLDVSPTEPATIFDVGCGEGSLCRDLYSQFGDKHTVIGVDISSFVLGIAIRKTRDAGISDLSYIKGDTLQLPALDNSVDIVVFANALKHLTTQENELLALAEQKRILRPNGQLLIIDGNDCEIEFQGADPDLTERVIKAYALLQGDQYAGSRISELCGLAGFSVERSETIELKEDSFHSENAGFAMARNMHAVLTEQALIDPASVIVSAEQVDEFLRQLEASAFDGTYRWRYKKYAVLAKHAERT